MHFKSQLRIRKLTKQLKLANQQSAPETKINRIKRLITLSNYCKSIMKPLIPI
ncbi:membrane protein [Vibrio cholerae]|nr:membrane protein [Vibrio cholerae]